MDRNSPQRLDPHVRKIATVIVLGMIMSILDATVINIALHDLSRDFGVPLDTIQWIATGYLLAVAATLPVTGWASRRYGSKRLYIIAIVLFTIGSILCGIAWSAESLIGFRVVQGIGGGLILPVGQMILVRASGPTALPRVMAAIGLPLVLAPVLGPTLGGLLLEHAGWRWIFFINVPIGVVAVIAARRMLPGDHGEDAGRLDLAGLMLASVGFVGITYGLAQTGSASSLAASSVVLPLLTGLTLVAAFVVRELRIDYPLLDVRLFRNRGFAWSAVACFLLGSAFFGSMVVLPLYFQVARGEGAAMAGLLIAPQGIGAAIGMRLSAIATERLGAGWTSLVGIMLTCIAMLPFVTLTADTAYLEMSASLVLRGVGMGLAIMPAMTAGYALMRSEQISHATPQLNMLQRVGGSMGTALIIVVLQHYLTNGAQTPDGAAHAFALTHWTLIAMTAVAIIPAIMLARIERRQGVVHATPPAIAVEAL